MILLVLGGKQGLIAIDQWLNTLIGGYADETVSARCYRQRHTSKYWRAGMKLIDFIFFWQPAHCEDAYIRELTRRQLPKQYSDLKSSAK